MPKPLSQVEPLLVPLPEELKACPNSVDSKATPLGGGQKLCFIHPGEGERIPCENEDKQNCPHAHRSPGPPEIAGRGGRSPALMLVGTQGHHKLDINVGGALFTPYAYEYGLNYSNKWT